jgi:uncharacterized protein YqgC (DUF456 family)
MQALLIIGIILIILGMIGSVTPAMPGPLLSFLGVLFLYFVKPNTVSHTALIVFGSITAFLLILDYLVPILGAKFSGASKKGLLGALLGGLFGIVFFPPIGIFLGAFLGALLGEMTSGKNPEQALKAGIGTLIGSVFSLILQVIFSLTVTVYFFIKLFS